MSFGVTSSYQTQLTIICEKQNGCGFEIEQQYPILSSENGSGQHEVSTTGAASNVVVDDDSSVLTNTEATFVQLGNDDIDSGGPCPWCEAMFGTTVIYQCCCCCFWNENDRRKCAIGVLYSKLYLLLYFAIIVITVTLLVFDFTQGINKLGKEEPDWFVALDIICVSLMVVDVFVQVMIYISALFCFFDRAKDYFFWFFLVSLVFVVVVFKL